MSTVLDLLKAPEFADRALTEAINVPPYVTGRLAQVGLFNDKPIATTYARIGISDGDITVIPARERGGPANKNMRNDKGLVLVNVPHFPLDDAITPSDLQNLEAFGEQNVMLTLQGVVNDKLGEMRAKHDATWSYSDWGAINGLVVDSEGKVLLNLFTQFGISQTTADLVLGTAGTDVASVTRDLRGTIRRQLKGSAFSGIQIFAGAEYFEAYVSHASVKTAYQYFAAQGPNPNRDALSDGFPYAGVTIERTDEEFAVRNADNTLTMVPGVASDQAIAVPLGTQYFRRYVAPPDSITDANTPPTADNKVFVSTVDLPHGKGREIHTESNVLPVCLRPQIMVKLSLS